MQVTHPVLALSSDLLELGDFLVGESVLPHEIIERVNVSINDLFKTEWAAVGNEITEKE